MTELKTSKILQPLATPKHYGIQGKMMMNSIYGLNSMVQQNISQILSIPTPMLGGSGKSTTSLQISAATALNSMSNLRGMSRLFRHTEFDFSIKKKHAVTNTFPFDYHKLNYDEISYENMFEVFLNNTIFERRASAEVYRLAKLISYYRNRKDTFKPQKPVFRGGKQKYGKFEGYHNEALLKKQNEAENNRLQKIIDDYNYELENIEEEHPEWLI